MVLFSLCAKLMQSVPLKKCKGFLLAVAEFASAGVAANVSNAYIETNELIQCLYR